MVSTAAAHSDASTPQSSRRLRLELSFLDTLGERSLLPAVEVVSLVRSEGSDDRFALLLRRLGLDSHHLSEATETGFVTGIT
jgi:hypothetical protein